MKINLRQPKGKNDVGKVFGWFFFLFYSVGFCLFVVFFHFRCREVECTRKKRPGEGEDLLVDSGAAGKEL